MSPANHSGLHAACPANAAPSPADEQRREPRQAYPFPQRFAPYREGRWPADDEFCAAEICDLSAHGLALWLAAPPADEWFVLEFGVGGNVSRRLVRVVQVERQDSPAIRYRVGCEFATADDRACQQS